MHKISNTLGHIRSVADHGNRAVAVADRGIVEITATFAKALRVRISRKGKLPSDGSPALASRGQSESNPLKVSALRGGASCRAQHLVAHLRFEPATLTFARPKGSQFAADLAVGFRGDHIVVRKAYNLTDRVYGLGEKTGWLDKRHRRYKMHNTDVCLENPAGLGSVTDPLYASLPFFIVHNGRQSYGLFLDNAEFTEFDFTAEGWYEFSAPADALTYYVFPGPTLPDVLRQYTDLTGRIPLPALWTLGFHQCRWGYSSEADIRRITSELRRRRIPADGIWMDIDYMDGYRVFTWDAKDFPRPREMIDDLKRDGFHAVTIVDPGVKVDSQYRVYREGKRRGHFIKHSDGKEYNGNVWPGRSAFPDFHRAETRAWWSGLVRQWLDDYGPSGIWNDMNEPASTDITGPIMDAWHEGGRLPHVSARNTYALQMARATHEGMLAQDHDSRPFILTRAAFSGAQTVAALWGGDNGAQWEHLAASLPMLMNLGLSGMPFVGVDIGGFMNDSHGELLARWTQAGAFYPFCRNHAAAGTRPHEPWAFGPKVEAICRRALNLRYQLLPHLYNLFHRSAQTGEPIMRPLVWHYPKDETTFNLNDQFMLGSEIIVAPVLTPGTVARSVYLPRGRWYRWGTDEESQGPAHILARAPLTELPLFVRSGAILPTWPLAQHTDAIERANVTLHVWPGTGRLDYYEDDGKSQAYTRSDWRLTPFRVRRDAARVVFVSGRPRGSYRSGRTEWTVILHTPSTSEVRLDNKPIRHRRTSNGIRVGVPDDGEEHRLVFLIRG